MFKNFLLFMFTVCIILALTGKINAQFVDSVHSITFGPNYSIGYGPDNIYFPDCIYGRPDSNATPLAGSFGPQNLLSLGTGGVIVLRFFNPIINGPGVDFTVFENPFYVVDTTYSFAETGIVAVSKDGVNFVEFPYRVDTVSITPFRVRYHGLAGVTPTNGQANPFDPGSPNQGHSGGDSFDLDSVGVDTVYFVKITDAADNVPDAGPAFDLDAVVVLNTVTGIYHVPGNVPDGFTLHQNYPNPFNPSTKIGFSIAERVHVRLDVFDALGRKVSELVNDVLQGGNYEKTFTADHLPSGIYYYRLEAGGQIKTMKMILVK